MAGISNLHDDHTPAAIARRLARTRRPSYLRDWVYGGIDGAVTTFAIVAGVVGANLGARVIIILGIANLIADGFSMAASNYVGTKTEHDDFERIMAGEREHIDRVPDGEREEVRQLLTGWGLEGQALDETTAAITSDPKRWVAFMMQEEHGLSPMMRSPLMAAASTYAAFALCGLIPLIPFFFGGPAAFSQSIAATGVAFAVIGAVKSRWSLKPAWQSVAETLAIGAAAAIAAYAVGDFLEALV